MKTQLDFERILEDCEFSDWQFIVGVAGYWVSDTDPQHEEPRLFLQVRATAPCAVTGEDHEWGGRKWLLSLHMTKSEVVQTALMAVLAAVEHEARESFMYEGLAIFSPHYHVDRLADLRREGASALDPREETSAPEPSSYCPSCGWRGEPEEFMIKRGCPGCGKDRVESIAP